MAALISEYPRYVRDRENRRRRAPRRFPPLGESIAIQLPIEQIGTYNTFYRPLSMGVGIKGWAGWNVSSRNLVTTPLDNRTSPVRTSRRPSVSE